MILFKSLFSIYYAQFIIWNCDAFISYMLGFVIWIFALFFPISWFLFLLWFCINEEFREWLKTKQKLFSKYLKEKSICTFHSEHIVKSKCSSAFKVLKEENVSCDYKNFYNTSSTGYFNIWRKLQIHINTYWINMTIVFSQKPILKNTTSVF